MASTDQPAVIVPVGIFYQSEKLIKKEKGQFVREGLELLLNNNLSQNETDPAELSADAKSADAIIEIGISWLVKYPHAALGVAINSDIPTIRKAFKKMALKYHPDKSPATKILFQVISSSCDLLCSDSRCEGRGTDSSRQGFEEYREHFFRQQKEMERQKELQRQKEQERLAREKRKQQKERREQEEKLRTDREDAEEELNWRSQRERHKTKQKAVDDDGDDDQQPAPPSRRSSFSSQSGSTDGGGGARGASGHSSGRHASNLLHRQQVNMLRKEDIKWQQLKRQYEKLVAKVEREEVSFKAEVEKKQKQRKRGSNQQTSTDSSLPDIHKNAAPQNSSAGTAAKETRPPKPTSAPHISKQFCNQQRSVPTEPPRQKRPTSERSASFRKTQSMPSDPSGPSQTTTTRPQPPSFTDGVSDLRKKYNHLFSQKSYASHSTKRARGRVGRSESIDLGVPTGDLSDRGNIVYSMYG